MKGLFLCFKKQLNKYNKMADKLFIFDTTLRDGEQVPGCQLNTVEKIQVAKALEALAPEYNLELKSERYNVS